uniref:Uncharacterized protein n=1 Tax=Anopheles melas TaxID=34690 RepID=A0A182UHC7_9DIPT
MTFCTSRQPFSAVSSTFGRWSRWNRCDISMKAIFPLLGSEATVSVGPPLVSSRWETSISGTFPFASDAVQAHTYSFKQMPASIRARVAALTDAHSILIEALSACFRWIVISCDLRSPRGRFFRSPVENVAMLYWQLTIASSKLLRFEDA